jgi:hypothetical protein
LEIFDVGNNRHVPPSVLHYLLVAIAEQARNFDLQL